MKYAAIYARVSSAKQEKDETVESQVDMLRRATAAAGYEIPQEWAFIDEGYSGARMDRPALDRLRDLAAEQLFDVVWITAPDRLARQYAYQVVVIDELKSQGCEVRFLNHAFGQTPEEQMLLQIQGVFAEYERALIRERTRRGRLFAARQGRYTCGGNAPYGFRYLPKTENTPQQLVVEEAEAAIVRQIYRWLIQQGLSSYAIAKRLYTQQVPTRRGHPYGWRQSTVISILRNPLYKGQAYYNRSMVVDAHRPHMAAGFKDRRPGNRRSRAYRPPEEWIPIRIPAIIDPETWELAQQQLAKNRERSKRNNTKHEYLLRGLLVCGKCDRRLAGAQRATGGLYMCPALKGFPPLACDGRSVSLTKVEDLVWNYVRELLSDPALLKAQYDQQRGDPAIDVQEEHERERIARKLQALQREEQRLLDAYQAEVIELDELKERRSRIKDHGRILEERQQQIEQQRRDREQELRLLEGLQAFCLSIRGALDEPSFEVKQKVLQLVVDRIIVEERRVVIRHIVPTGPVRLQTEQHPCKNSQ